MKNLSQETKEILHDAGIKIKYFAGWRYDDILLWLQCNPNVYIDHISEALERAAYEITYGLRSLGYNNSF